MIQVQNVSKSFQRPSKSGGPLPVLRNVSLTVNLSERLAIMGQSGSGKSTLLHLMGLLDQPDSGQIKIDGKDAHFLSEEAQSRLRASRLGFVFQHHYLLPEFSALENVMMPALLIGRTRAQASQRAKELLERVQLSQRMEHRPGELSGGEQQRVSIARSLMNSPGIILADEPTGNLDAANGENVISILIEMVIQQNVSLIVVTHDDRIANRMDRILKLEAGEIRGV